MSCDFTRTATEFLQEEYEKLGRLRYDDSLGDAYRSLCACRREEIALELKKRNACDPGADMPERRTADRRLMCGIERVLRDHGQAALGDCMERGGGVTGDV